MWSHIEQIDIKADKCVFDALKYCRVVACASSEERPEEIDLGGHGFSVRRACMLHFSDGPDHHTDGHADFDA